MAARSRGAIVCGVLGVGLAAAAVYSYCFSRRRVKEHAFVSQPPQVDNCKAIEPEPLVTSITTCCSASAQVSGTGSCREQELEDVRGPYPDLSSDLAGRLAPIHEFLSTEDDAECEYSIPENISVYVKTFGCSHNMSDSETMMGLLQKAGFRLVDSMEGAAVAVLNSCTVKNPSQDGLVNLAVKCKAAGKHVVLAGCVVQADRGIRELQEMSAIGVLQVDRIVEAVTETLKGNIYHALGTRRELPALDLPKHFTSPVAAVIPLSTGCLGACTYCKTKHARGALGSYRPEAILQRVGVALREGVRQIWLTSEDTGAYGLDIGFNIAELLNQIKEVLVAEKQATGDHVMVRLGMTNPPFILEHLPSLAQTLASDHFFEFVHIPVQSGSNRVLKEMNREYTVEEFQECADGLRSRVPNITIATDFICGFPGENEDDHKDSLALVDRYRFPVMNISQFYPRPGTPAATRKREPTQIVKSRSQELTRMFMDYKTFDNWLGKEVMVWFSGVSDRSNHMVGHTKEYIKVLVENDKKLMGTNKLVRIFEISKWHMMGAS